MSQDNLSWPPFLSLRYSDDSVQNFLRLVALGTRFLKAGLPEGVCRRLHVQVKLKGTPNTKLKAHFMVSSITMASFVNFCYNYRYCLLSGVTSVDLVKFGVVRLKTFLLSPPTTTWAPSKGTNTARLCRVMATRESLVSLIPNKICNRESREDTIM